MKFNIFKSVSPTLRKIYQSAYMPLGNEDHSIQVLQRDIDEVLSYATKSRTRIVKTPESRDVFFKKYNLNKLYHYSILCRCFLKSEAIGEVNKRNCHCNDPIPALNFYADQLFDRTQKILFSEEDKALYKKLLGGEFILFHGKLYCHSLLRDDIVLDKS